MFHHVLLESFCPSKPFLTDCTYMAILSSMMLQVFPEIAAWRETFLANLTCKRFPFMFHHVILEFTWLSKPFLTSVTFVFKPSMMLHMFLKTMLCCILLFTFPAVVEFPFMSHNMPIVVVSPSEPFLTNMTWKSVLPSMVLHVLMITTFRIEFSLANPTLQDGIFAPMLQRAVRSQWIV